MKQIILTVFSFLMIVNISLKANNLSKNSVVGKVTDMENKPIHRVTVSLLKASDSTLVKAEITNEEGEYRFLTSIAGTYIVCFTSAGYEKTYSEKFILNENGEVNLPTIKMPHAIKKLQGVVVSAKKPMIEVKADKTIFNVENSINATGSTALELLKKSPGVQVDNNDNISMNGKNGVKIYIDGKMLQLDAKNAAEYLKGINSNDIESIEIITNPGAKYDAEGNAGIINIKLKKNKKFGTNGSASVGMIQGVTPKGNGSFSLNYRDKKVNIFSNASGSIGDWKNTQNIFRAQSDTIFDMKSTQVSHNNNLNGKAGFDYFINKNNTFGIMANASLGEHNWSSHSNTPVYYEPTMVFVKTLAAGNDVPNRNVNANFNTNYRFADTSGKEINIDADYGLFRSRSNSFQPNSYIDPSGNLMSKVVYKNNTPVDIDIYSLKADFEQKLGKGKLGYGAKTSYVITQNSFDFYNVENNQDIKVLNKSNSFKYKENINAAYLSYQLQFGERLDMQAGLRLEHTYSNGILTRADGIYQNDNNVKRNYVNLFPSAALSFKLNKKNSFNLAYSRRIDRPSYQDLNPFENKLDELTYQKGNAFLRPQYTDNIELKHIFAGMLTTSFAYSHVKDYATEALDTTNSNATFIQQKNLATQQILSWHISSPLPIRKWWNGYLEFWFNTLIFDGSLNNKNIHAAINNYGVYSTQSISLPSSFSIEMSGWYSGPNIWGATGKTKPQGSLDMGIQKTFLQKRASVRLSVNDLFATASPWRINSDFGGLRMNGNGTWESRTLRLNFTYRFGSAQINAARQRQTGLESESSRIKG